MSTTTSQIDSINHDLSTQFQVLESLLDTLPTLPAPTRLTALSTALQTLSTLSSHLSTVLPHLPAYSQRQHTTHLSTLTTRLTTLRAQLTPRPKFSFKTRKTTRTSPIIGGDIAPVNTPAPLAHTESTQGSNISITARKGELIRIAAATPGASLLLDDIDGCVILLEGARGSFSSAAAKGVRGSVVVLGEALDGPMHITGLEGSVLVLRCRQLRMHEARESEVYLWCKSSPIVEDCEGVRFAPYGDEEEGNMWADVKDFKWLRGDEPSPNWGLVPVEERRKDLGEGKIEGGDVGEILSRFVRR